MGKSSLINFILGKNVCKVGGPGELFAFGLKPQTQAVEKTSVHMNGILVTVYDSPGLQDGTTNEQKYLAEMYKKCRDVDLVFYCLEMITTRWTPPEIESIRLLTEKFGGTFWDKAIFVLTKGNLVQSPEADDDDPEAEKELTKRYFLNAKETFEKKVRAEVKKQTIDAKVRDPPKYFESLPVVPAGSEAEQILPDRKHFIGNLWITCLERIDPNRAEIFMQATNTEERVVSYDDVEEKEEKKGLFGFIPTMDDVRKAWRVLFRRRKKINNTQPKEPVKKDTAHTVHTVKEIKNEEPEYPIYLDKNDSKRLRDVAYTIKGIRGTEAGGAVFDRLGRLIKFNVRID